MPLYRSNTPSCSRLEVAALITEAPESLNPRPQNDNTFSFLMPTSVHKNEPNLSLNKAVKKRSGLGVTVRNALILTF
jgi:hypothetical protein